MIDLLSRNIWLTLVGHADTIGIITTVSIDTLRDFCREHSRNAVVAEIDLLIANSRLRRLDSGHRRHYQLIGDAWRDDIPAARHYVAQELSRVRAIQNRRARQGQQYQADPSLPRVRIAKLELVDTHHPLKYTCTVQLTGVGSIYQVVALERSDGTIYLSEPSKRVDGAWHKMLDFETSLASDIIAKLIETAMDQHLPLPRAYGQPPASSEAS